MKIADFNDKKMIEKYVKTPISHPYIIFPKLLELLGDIKDKRILDLGCGGGNLSIMLVKKGAGVKGIDISKKWIEKCKKDYPDYSRLDFSVGDSSELKDIQGNKFDAVIMNMVFLNIESKEKVEKTFHEVSRVLKKGGIFLFTDLHPLCLMIPDTLTEHQEYLDNFSYFKDGSKYTSKVILKDETSSINFVDMHWTLETYSKFINDAGMYIYRIIEPQPIPSAPNLFKDYKLPEYILFYCKK